MVWVLVNAGPQFDAFGKLSKIIVTFMDISEKRKTEREWGITLNAISDWICLLNRDAFILRSNSAVDKILGLTPKEVIGKKIPDKDY